MNDKYNWKVIGGVFITLSYGLGAVVLVIARSLGINQWGDLFSLGQLIFDFLLLPAAIIGFIVTIGELRKAQAIPKLIVYWETEPGILGNTLDLSNRLKSASLNGARPVLMNEGNSVSVWYVIHFDIPIHIYSASNLRVEELPKQWVLHAGITSDWRIDILPEKMRVTFMSNSHVASYPNYPLSLGILTLPSVINDRHDKKFEIPYTIATDHGKPFNNVLKIQLNHETE
jgi:hypothetical protein